MASGIVDSTSRSTIKNDKFKSIISFLIKVTQVLLGCLLFGWLIWYFLSNNLADTLNKINLISFVLSILCWIFVGIIMSKRLEYINNHNFSLDIPLKNIFKINQLGMLLSDFTPGRSGYFGVIYYMKKEWKLEYEKSFGTLIGIQLIDFIFKALFSVLAIVLMVQIANINIVIEFELIIGLIAFILIVMICFSIIWYNKTVYITYFLQKIPFGYKLSELICRLTNGVSTIKPSWRYICLYSVAGTAMIALQWWLLGISIGIQISPIYYLVIPSLVSIIAFIPIGIAGMGIQEFGVTAILISLGNPAGYAIAFSILLRLCNILGDLTGLIKLIEGWLIPLDKR